MRSGSSAPGRRGLSAPSSGHPAGCLDNGPKWGVLGWTPGVAEAFGHVPPRDAILLLARSPRLQLDRGLEPGARPAPLSSGMGEPGHRAVRAWEPPRPTPDTKAQGHRAASAVYKCLLLTGVFVNGLLFPLLGQGIRIQRRGL